MVVPYYSLFLCSLCSGPVFHWFHIPSSCVLVCIFIHWVRSYRIVGLSCLFGIYLFLGIIDYRSVPVPIFPVDRVKGMTLCVYTCVILSTQVRRRSGPKCCGQDFFHWPKTCRLYTLYQDFHISCQNTQKQGFLKLFGEITVENFYQLKIHVLRTPLFEFCDRYPVFWLFFPTSVWGLKLLVYTELQWIQSVQSKSSCASCNSFLLTSCHCSIDVLLSCRFSNFCRLLSRVWDGSSVSTSRWNVCSCWHVLSCWSSVCFLARHLN
jgi:hypothetical protein